MLLTKMSQIVNTFSDWLLTELAVREWSQSDLARRANVSKAAISDVISGRRNVGKDLATSIADALRLPPEQVFRVAGLLPPAVEIDDEIEQIVHEVKDMTRDEQQEILSYIRYRNNQRKKK